MSLHRASQVHIQPFRDMIDGMRMDLVKSRYRTYDELYGYCYKVAGTVALMTTPVMGIDPAYQVWPPQALTFMSLCSSGAAPMTDEVAMQDLVQSVTH